MNPKKLKRKKKKYVKRVSKFAKYLDNHKYILFDEALIATLYECVRNVQRDL